MYFEENLFYEVTLMYFRQSSLMYAHKAQYTYATSSMWVHVLCHYLHILFMIFKLVPHIDPIHKFALKTESRWSKLSIHKFALKQTFILSNRTPYKLIIKESRNVQRWQGSLWSFQYEAIFHPEQSYTVKLS